MPVLEPGGCGDLLPAHQLCDGGQPRLTTQHRQPRLARRLSAPANSRWVFRTGLQGGGLFNGPGYFFTDSDRESFPNPVWWYRDTSVVNPDPARTQNIEDKKIPFRIWI